MLLGKNRNIALRTVSYNYADRVFTSKQCISQDTSTLYIWRDGANILTFTCLDELLLQVPLELIAERTKEKIFYLVSSAAPVENQAGLVVTASDDFRKFKFEIKTGSSKEFYEYDILTLKQDMTQWQRESMRTIKFNDLYTSKEGRVIQSSVLVNRIPNPVNVMTPYYGVSSTQLCRLSATVRRFDTSQKELVADAPTNNYTPIIQMDKDYLARLSSTNYINEAVIIPIPTKALSNTHYLYMLTFHFVRARINKVENSGIITNAADTKWCGLYETLVYYEAETSASLIKWFADNTDVFLDDKAHVDLYLSRLQVLSGLTPSGKLTVDKLDGGTRLEVFALIVAILAAHALTGYEIPKRFQKLVNTVHDFLK